MVEALYQELDESVEHFQLVQYRADLDQALVAGKIALILSFEGADPLDRDVSLARLFHRLGLRLIGLTWNRANPFAQGPAEDTGAGLSTVGRELLQVMDRLGMVLDVSHLSESSFWSALEHFKGPVFASHSNARAVTDHPRNLWDDQLKALADRGGLIGLNFYPSFVDSRDLLGSLAQHAQHIREVTGLEHVALGPDFIDYLQGIREPLKQRLRPPGQPEGPAVLPDVSILPAFRQKLLDTGWSEADAQALFGDNALWFLSSVLPVERT
jgi:membrane dipeptidase